MSRNSLKNGAAVAGTGAGLLLVWLTVSAIGIGITSWILMLLIGAVHNSVWEAVPAIGFWPSVLVTVFLSFIGSFFRRS